MTRCQLSCSIPFGFHLWKEGHAFSASAQLNSEPQWLTCPSPHSVSPNLLDLGHLLQNAVSPMPPEFIMPKLTSRQKDYPGERISVTKLLCFPGEAGWLAGRTAAAIFFSCFLQARLTHLLSDSGPAERLENQILSSKPPYIWRWPRDTDLASKHLQEFAGDASGKAQSLPKSL